MTGAESARRAPWPAPIRPSRWSPPTRRLTAARRGAAASRARRALLRHNSVAPGTKQAAARAIEAAGGRYADVAVMAPVHPGCGSPFLCWSAARTPTRRCAALAASGFSDVHDRRRAGRRRLGDQDDPLGDGEGDRGADRRMLRSPREAAGVRDEVVASLDASWPGSRLGRDRADYNLDRMLDARRAARRRDGGGRCRRSTRSASRSEMSARARTASARSGASALRRRPLDGRSTPWLAGKMRGMTLIIDCHGHYTTAPAAHDDWRDAQKAAFKAGEAPPPYPAISRRRDPRDASSRTSSG